MRLSPLRPTAKCKGDEAQLKLLLGLVESNQRGAEDAVRALIKQGNADSDTRACKLNTTKASKRPPHACDV